MPRLKHSKIDPVEIDGCQCLRATDKAILVRIQDDLELWIPQSVVHDDSEVWKEDDEGTLIVAGWFAEKNGLV